MPLPAERISLNCNERAAILPGLNMILNGSVELLRGFRPSPERMWGSSIRKFSPREFDQQLFDSVLRLRNRLAALSAPDVIKPYLNAIDLAIAAFAVRIARRRTPTDADRALESKLEKYRKRAKRSTIKHLGRDFYRQEQATWKSFQNWVRFNVLTLRIPTRPLLRRIRQDQRETLLSIAKEVIAERCMQPLAPERLRHLVDLAIREIRRGRHKTIKVRSILADANAARDFMFGFIKKREPDLKLRYEFLNACEQAALRGERMRKALVLENDETELRVALAPISEKKLVNRIAQFFEEVVAKEEWERVAEQCEFMSRRLSISAIVIDATTLDDLLAQTKPKYKPTDLPDLLNFHAEWLLGFLLAANASSERAARLIRSGWILAAKRCRS
jgi:hypothetical protein